MRKGLTTIDREEHMWLKSATSAPQLCSGIISSCNLKCRICNAYIDIVIYRYNSCVSYHNTASDEYQSDDSSNWKLKWVAFYVVYIPLQEFKICSNNRNPYDKSKDAWHEMILCNHSSIKYVLYIHVATYIHIRAEQ